MTARPYYRWGFIARTHDSRYFLCLTIYGVWVYLFFQYIRKRLIIHDCCFSLTICDAVKQAPFCTQPLLPPRLLAALRVIFVGPLAHMANSTRPCASHHQSGVTALPTLYYVALQRPRPLLPDDVRLSPRSLLLTVADMHML